VTAARAVLALTINEHPRRRPLCASEGGGATTRSRLLITAGLAAWLLAATAPTVAAADPAVTLRLATPEDQDRRGEAILGAFRDEVARASRGSMAVDIVWSTGGLMDDKERVTAQRVMSGDVELAAVPVRAWNDVGVTSLQALMAPSLIDGDAILRAVADDPLVAPMLDGMADQGLVGLAIWPEDLRHPFTFDQNGPPLLSPADFQGQNIFVGRSTLQNDIIRTLGATPFNIFPPDVFVDDGTLRGAESGLLDGIYTLYGSPTATGDVTLYPKYVSLVAEDSAWSRLSADQQRIIREAAATARVADLTNLPTDTSLAEAYCATGGRVVQAGAANRAAFIQAAQPLYERMRRDPLTATAIDAITELKSSIAPSGLAAACGPPISATATIPPVTPGPAAELIPDGVYRKELTAQGIMARGADAIFADNNAGTWTITVDGNAATFTIKHPAGDTETCPLEQAVQGDVLRVTFVGQCAGGWIEFRWIMNEETLDLTAVNEASRLVTELVKDNAGFGGPWTRIE
jgi:TRAP-type C4-dicarboxylate transport system substrate-binding protein